MQAGGLGHGDKGVGVIDGGGAATKGGGSGLDGDYDFFFIKIDLDDVKAPVGYLVCICSRR